MPTLKEASKARKSETATTKAPEVKAQEQSIKSGKAKKPMPTPSTDPKRSMAAKKAAQTRKVNKARAQLGLAKTETSPGATGMVQQSLSDLGQQLAHVQAGGDLAPVETTEEILANPEYYRTSRQDLAVQSVALDHATEQIAVDTKGIKAQTALINKQKAAVEQEIATLKLQQTQVKKVGQQAQLVEEVARTEDKIAEATHQQEVTELNHEGRKARATIKRVDTKKLVQKARKKQAAFAKEMRVNPNDVIDTPYTEVPKTKGTQPTTEPPNLF